MRALGGDARTGRSRASCSSPTRTRARSRGSTRRCRWRRSPTASTPRASPRRRRRARRDRVHRRARRARPTSRPPLRLAQRIMPLVRRELPGRAADDRRPRARPGGARARAASSPTSPTCGRGCGAPPSTRARWRAAPGSRTSCWRRWRRARPRWRRRSPARGIDAARTSLVADSDADVRRRRSSRCCATASAPPGGATAARAYVRARHDWDAVAAAYLALYEADRP